MTANITLSATIGVHLADSHAPVRLTVKAGAAFVAGQGGFIHTDGTAHLIDKTICTISNVSKWQGIALNAAAIGEPVTLFGIGAKVYITDATLTIGSFWYVSTTPGAFYDAAVASADTYLPCLKAISDHVVEVVRGGI